MLRYRGVEAICVWILSEMRVTTHGALCLDMPEKRAKKAVAKKTHYKDSLLLIFSGGQNTIPYCMSTFTWRTLKKAS